MVKHFFNADKAYIAPVCDLLDAALEDNFCVSGSGRRKIGVTFNSPAL